MDLWEYVVRLIDNDYSSLLDVSGCQVGMTTRFQSNAIRLYLSQKYIRCRTIK